MLLTCSKCNEIKENPANSWCRACRNKYQRDRKAKLIAEGKCYCGRTLEDGYRQCKVCRPPQGEKGPYGPKLKYNGDTPWEAFLKMYGSQCACCAEANKAFLTIEHLQGMAGQDRAKSNTRHELVKALREYRPDLYAVLCFNCNMGKAHRGHGTCPHLLEDKKDKVDKRFSLQRQRALAAEGDLDGLTYLLSGRVAPTGHAP